MKKIDLRFSVEVPDDTDPQLVREVVDAEFEYAAAGGGPCNWRGQGWVPGPAELIEAPLATSP
jgi:hypothetical protein